MTPFFIGCFYRKGPAFTYLFEYNNQTSLWTIHNGVFDAPTVYILTWPRFTVKMLAIYCIQRQYLSF